MIGEAEQVSKNFGEAVDAYKLFRPTYPRALFDYLFEQTIAEHTTAIDLGAGTGLCAQELSYAFDYVIAVEPDARMAAKISELSPKIKVCTCAAEDFSVNSKSADLVTAGNAFYWMDGPRIAESSAKWLCKNGVFAVFRYGFPRTIPDVQAILLKELEKHWDSYRHERLRDEDYSWRVIQSAPSFRHVDRSIIPNTIQLQARELVGFFASTSYGSAYIAALPPDNNYLSALVDLVGYASGNSNIPVDFSLELIVART